jgi:hypothetical protein
MKRLILSALLVAGTIAPALAQTPAPVQAVKVRGTIVSVTPTTVTIAGLAGAPTVIALMPMVRYAYFVKAGLDQIPTGSYIGAAAEQQPDGTLKAIAVQIFAAKPNTGFGPWDLTPTSTMTNGAVDTISATKVDKVDASVLSVSYEGGAKNVVITPKTAIVAVVPADASALKPGAHVLIFALKAADGTYTARAIDVGKDGMVPPL